MNAHFYSLIKKKEFREQVKFAVDIVTQVQSVFV